MSGPPPEVGPGSIVYGVQPMENVPRPQAVGASEHLTEVPKQSYGEAGALGWPSRPKHPRCLTGSARLPSTSGTRPSVQYWTEGEASETPVTFANFSVGPSQYEGRIVRTLPSFEAGCYYSYQPDPNSSPSCRTIQVCF